MAVLKCRTVDLIRNLTLFPPDSVVGGERFRAVGKGRRENDCDHTRCEHVPRYANRGSAFLPLLSSRRERQYITLPYHRLHAGLFKSPFLTFCSLAGNPVPISAPCEETLRCRSVERWSGVIYSIYTSGSSRQNRRAYPLLLHNICVAVVRSVPPE